MTSDALPAGGDPRRLLADTRHLALRVRVAQRVTWLALLVLAWLERHVALLLFTLGYLVVVLVPIDFGWGDGWGDRWGSAPPLVISGGLLLLGSAGFALAQRRSR